jgi:hypothetical protein
VEVFIYIFLGFGATRISLVVAHYLELCMHVNCLLIQSFFCSQAVRVLYLLRVMFNAWTITEKFNVHIEGELKPKHFGIGSTPFSS